jgi:hypothetical protein
MKVLESNSPIQEAAPTQIIKEIVLPLNQKPEEDLGWILDYDFLEEIQKRTGNYGGFPSGLEQTESVILALFGFPEMETTDSE